MHRRILTIGILLLASLVLFGDWTFDAFTISIPDEDFETDALSFGTATGASESFDDGVDVVSPPCPPGSPCVFFPIDDPLIDGLIDDFRAPAEPGDSIFWTLNIAGTMSSGHVTWESGDLPAGGDFYIVGAYPGAPVDWAEAADMRAIDSTDFLASQQVKIKYIAPTETPEDTEPPVVTSMDPEDGATGVSPTATISFELIDEGSEATVDESSVAISIDGISIPGPTSYATPIAGGYNFSISPGDIPMMTEWPEGDHVVSIDACDPIPNCMETFEYNFSVEASSTEYEISGSVEIVGSTDPSDVDVIMFPDTLRDTTGAAGTWSFTPDVAGEYTIDAFKAGYISTSAIEVTLTEESPISSDNLITLEPEGPEEVMLYGTVNLSDEPSDLSGSVVSVDGYGDATTLDDGSYEITGLPVDTDLDITVTHPGYVMHETTLSLTADTEQDFLLEAEAEPTYTVSGNFTLAGEDDHSGITVELTGEEATTTDATGYYEFTEIENGDYTITASMDGFVDYSEDFTVEDANVEISAELDAEVVSLAPPGPVTASESYLYWIVVRWDEPLDEGLYEIYYDDGEADDAGGGFTHIGIGGDPTWEMGVEFTPPEEDCTLISVRYNLLVNSTGGTPTMDFRVREMIADTPSDELIPGPVYEEVDSTLDWNVIEIAGGLALESDDDFFCGFRDVVIGSDTTALYVGCDKTDSDERSWIYMPSSGWGLVSGFASPATIELSDFMIRALVRLPDGSLCELAPEGSGIPPRRFPPVNTRFDEPKAANMVPNDANPFFEDYIVDRSFDNETESLKRDFESMEVDSYKVYRSMSPFDAIDEPGVEHIATVPAESLVYYDSFSDSVVTIDPFEWVWYGVTALYPEGESELAAIDSGYYQDFYPDAQILLVDMSGGTDIASGGTESEPDFLYRIMTTELGIPEDSIYQTEIGEGLGRAVLEMYDLVIIVSGMMSGTTIDISSRQWEALKEYIDAGGNVYYEGCVTPLSYFEVLEDFDTYFGYVHSYPDYISHSDDTGNVEWCETTPEFQAVTGGAYLQMDYLTYTVADFRVAELEPAMGAQGWFRSQDSTAAIPIPHSRNRMVYKPQTDTSATVFSSVYLGAFMDEDEEPDTREYMLGKLLWGAFDITNDAIAEEAAALPEDVMLESNSPNPFNGATRIEYSLPDPSHAELAIYDINGTKIRTLIDGYMMRGMHAATWDAKDDMGNDVPTGVYFYKLTTRFGEETKTMLYMK